MRVVKRSVPYSDEKFKSKHLRNAMSVLVLCFLGFVGFILLLAPPEDPSTSGGLVELFVKDLVQIEKSSLLRGSLSSSQSESMSIAIENKNISPQKEAHLNINKGNTQGCLTELPADAGPHIVDPPEGPATLVCCQTTKGPLSIAVHEAWAPLGARRFLDMVKTEFFSTKVGLFRALKGFIIQFGLAGDPSIHEAWNKKGHLPDDPSWLPLGPPGREINGVKRFQKGYLAYAGAGKNSRGTQLIVAFENNAYLAGGSPWEVPWGQVVGKESFKTLDSVYTGYGEKVSQGKIINRGNQYLEEEFPLLDYITECCTVQENLPWIYRNKSGSHAQ